MAINLLPKDISERNKATNRGRSHSYVTIFLLFVGIFVLIGGALLVFIQQGRVNTLKAQQQELVDEIRNYQQQEMQVVLLKDRLTNIEEVFSTRTVEQIRDLQRILLDTLPEGMSMNLQEADGLENQFSVTANSAITLRNYIKEIGNNEQLGIITLDQLVYNPLEGYQAVFKLN